MLTYQELIEKKLNQLNQQHVGTVKGLETAMHSQGIDPGEPKRDAHHVNYPKAKFKKSGKPASGITGVDNGKGKLTSSTGGVTIRDAVLKSGRVDKRPAAKAERAKVAAENKAKKAKQRDPFTREHSEWWLDMWRLDERAFSPAGQAARAKMRAQNAQNLVNKVNPRTGTSMKALPPAKKQSPGLIGTTERTPVKKQAPKPEWNKESGTGYPKTRKTGALALRPNSKGSNIVKSPSGSLTKSPSKKSSMVRMTDTAPKGKNREGSQVGKRAPATKGYMTSPAGIRKPNNSDKSKNPIHGTTTSKNSQKPGGPQKSDYTKAREERDINNKLDKEDKNKGKTWKDLRAVGKYVGKNVGKKALEVGKQSVTDGPGSSGPDSVQGSSEIVRGRRS